MRSRWTPERVVGPDRAAVLVARAVPALAGRPVEPLADGWDHTVHLVDRTWTFRFPRRAMALPGFRREIAVLPRLAGVVPVAVPSPEHVGEDDDPLAPWPFAGARFVPGVELADRGLADADRVDLGAHLGQTLRVLHKVAPTTWGAADMPLDPMQRGHPRARSDDTRAALTELVAGGAWVPQDAVLRLLDRADRLGPPVGPPVLVHGDLHVRHVVVDPAGRLGGLIDWGDLCRADPAVDLAIAYAAFSGRGRRALLGAYGQVDGERELRARALAVRLSALLAAYAADTGREALLAEAVTGLGRATR